MRSPIPIVLCIASLAAPAWAQPFDHHDPAVLVARAREALREDDFRTACVLLARAGQLAPHDARIQLAWGDFEARQRGLPIGQAPTPKAEPAPPAPRPIPPEPPAPWPAK